MLMRICGVLFLATITLLAHFPSEPADACCPAPAHWDQPVVNADQSVIIIWDAASQTQHFIRQASFKSEADDFGFLIPSPSEPELSESGDAAFPHLVQLTAPEVRRASSHGIGCGCAASPSANLLDGGVCRAPPVTVLQEKTVAGFKAAVLQTASSTALVGWLKDNGYAFSPEIEAWAKPYVEGGWKITALKIEKGKDGKNSRDVAASSLRMSFKTDRPLFPYREPDNKSSAEKIGAKRRTLAIYFIAESRYEGGFAYDEAVVNSIAPSLRPANYTGPWTGRVVWAGKIKQPERQKLLEELKLPETTGPAQWWLTEFEDNWPYKLAPEDVYFRPARTQEPVRRAPILSSAASPWPTDFTVYALAGALVMPSLVSRMRRRWKK
jgi:hypothetical protein